MCPGLETGEWLAEPTAGQLQRKDPFCLSWLDAGTTEEKTQQTSARRDEVDRGECTQRCVRDSHVEVTRRADSERT